MRNLKAWESASPFPKIKVLASYPPKKEDVGRRAALKRVEEMVRKGESGSVSFETAAPKDHMQAGRPIRREIIVVQAQWS